MKKELVELAKQSRWFVVENGPYTDVHARLSPAGQEPREITVHSRIDPATAQRIVRRHNKAIGLEEVG